MFIWFRREAASPPPQSAFLSLIFIRIIGLTVQHGDFLICFSNALQLTELVMPACTLSKIKSGCLRGWLRRKIEKENRKGAKSRIFIWNMGRAMQEGLSLGVLTHLHLRHLKTLKHQCLHTYSALECPQSVNIPSWWRGRRMNVVRGTSHPRHAQSLPFCPCLDASTHAAQKPP